MTIDDLVQVLKKIAELKPDPFVMPLDFESNIKACAECRSYDNHSIQRGICNKHRQPLLDRISHDQYEAMAIGSRCQEIARRALDQFGKENYYPN